MEKKPFLTCTPEEAGIPSSAIIRYLNALKRQRVCLHSLLIIRNDKIAYEANWAPMKSTELHRMYSVSKSFVSVAVGMLQDEGKISIDDKIIDYFPEYQSENLHPYHRNATIKDMLKMSSLFDDQPYDGAKDTDWISTFFHTKPQHESGSIMCYDTMATVLCTAIVERVTGQKILDYMRPKFLNPIGFSQDAWCVETPCGLSWAGSGIMCSVRDLAKFANVVMHYGQFEGKQILPSDYLREATSYQISNFVNKATIQEGYGYQFWRTSENGFGCFGMGSQIAICLPDKDMVIAMTGDTQEMETRQYAAYHLFFDLVYPEIKDEPVSKETDSANALIEMTSQLSLQNAPGEAVHPVMNLIHHKQYVMDDNPLHWKSVRFDFHDDEGILTYVNDRGEKQIRFGLGKQVITSFPETHYSGYKISVPIQREYRCAVSAGWDIPGTLTLVCYIIDDYFGTLKMNFSFKEESMTMYASKVAEWFLDDYQGTATGHLQTV